MGKENNQKYNLLLEKTLEKNLPAEQLRYIKQPYNFTILHGKVTKEQQKQLVAIMDVLQPKIDKWLAMSAAEKLDQPRLFNEPADLTVSIRLVDMGIRPRSYESMRDAAKLFLSQIYEYPVVDKNGDRKVAYAPLFKEVRVPEKNETSTNAVTIDFRFNDALLTSDLMLMNRYSKYSREVALNSGLYTSRLYVILTSYIYSKDKMWCVEYSELRKIVGVDELKQSRQGAWKKDKYRRWSDFKKRVLESSRMELDELANSGIAECTFTYEEIRSTGIKSADPQSIVFHVHLTETGRRMSEMKDRRRRLEDQMCSLLGLTKNDIKKINLALYEMDEDVAIQLMRNIRSSMANRKDIEKRTNYAIRALNNEILAWLEKSNTPPIEEVVAVEVPGQQQIDFEGSTNLQDRWEDVLDAAEGVFRGKDQTRRYFGGFFLVSFEDNVLTIGARSQNAINYYLDAVDYVPKMNDVFKRIFGDSVRVKFVVTEKGR